VKAVVHIYVRRFGPVLRSYRLIGYFSIVIVTAIASELRRSLVGAISALHLLCRVLKSIYQNKSCQLSSLFYSKIEAAFLPARLEKSGSTVTFSALSDHSPEI
jgi:hypothetical protein